MILIIIIMVMIITIIITTIMIIMMVPQVSPSCAARSCPFSICSSRLSTVWLVSLDSVFVVWSPCDDKLGRSVAFEAVDVPCPVPLRISPLLIIDFRSLCALCFIVIVVHITAFVDGRSCHIDTEQLVWWQISNETDL